MFLFLFGVFFIPFVVFCPSFFSLLPSRNSDPWYHFGWLIPPLPTRKVCALRFIFSFLNREKAFGPFLPSSPRVLLCWMASEVHSMCRAVLYARRQYGLVASGSVQGVDARMLLACTFFLDGVGPSLFDWNGKYKDRLTRYLVSNASNQCRTSVAPFLDTNVPIFRSWDI